MNAPIRHRILASLAAAALLCPTGHASAQLPGLPTLPTLPTLPSLPWPTLTPSPGGASSPGGLGSGAAILGVCALVGGAGAMLAKKLAARESQRLSLSPQEAKKRERGYMLGWALAGCLVGGGVTANVIKNLSASARKAQEDAWRQAQQQTGPVSWQDPNNGKTRGTTEIVERETLPDGGECGTRRDIIEAEEGTAEPMQRVCRTAGTTEWRPVVG